MTLTSGTHAPDLTDLRGYELARIRTGTVTVNGAIFDTTVPFDGCKQSRVGHGGGPEGLGCFLEMKSVHMSA